MRWLALILLVGASGAAAQPHNWAPIQPENGVSASVQTIVPGLRGTLVNAVLFVGLRREVGYGVRVEAEVPVAVGTGSGGGVALGNSYLGVAREVASGARGVADVGLGLRPPLSPDPGGSGAATVGGLSEIERPALFQNDVLVLTAYLDGRHAVGRDVTLRIRLAPTLAGASFGTADPYLGFLAQSVYETGPTHIAVGASGLGYLGDVGSNGRRVLLFGGLAADTDAGAVRPGAFLRFPLAGPSLGFLGGARTVVGFSVSAPL